MENILDLFLKLDNIHQEDKQDKKERYIRDLKLLYVAITRALHELDIIN